MQPSGTLVPPHCHAVSFFKDQSQLCDEIALFVGEGLVLDQPALVVTSEPHREGIVAALAARGVSADRAVDRGDLLLVDAEDTLASIMRGGMPDDLLYHEQVGAAVRETLRGRPGPLRIYGDMVDLLWQREQYEAAIRIEILSNQLAVLQPILVICGYSMGHFLKTAARLEAVRALHGHVHQPKGSAA